MPQSRTQRTTDGPTSASEGTAGEMDSRLTALRQQIETNQDQVCENAEAMPLPLLILHAADGKVAFANTAAEEAFGYNLSPTDRRQIKKIIYEHFDYIEQQWDSFQSRRRVPR